MSGARQIKRVAHRQKGFALVLALLVVALVTAIAVELSWRFDLAVTRAENRWHGVQAYAYLQGAEEFAFMALRFDKEEDNKNGKEMDTLNEVWAMPAQFPTDEGWIAGSLEDAQARFNLNLLAEKAPKPQGGRFDTWEKFTAPQRRFIRLLQSINLGSEEDETYLDLATATNITEAIMDWMDKDSEVTGYGGAESDYYGSLEPPFVIRNTPMVSVTELYIIRGMTPELYKKLLPLVIVLDVGMHTNVNTMPVELLRSINSKKVLYPISLEDAQYIVDERNAGGYETLENFQNSAAIDQVVGASQNGQSNLDTKGLGVFSAYFLFTGETQVGDHIRRSKALLYRNGTEVSTLRRTDANY